ncbi:MAG: ATP-binding cassette domain-containing protein, partial [Gemmatimonadaceae bacterium]
MPPVLAARAVEKRYGRVEALRGVDLEVGEGQLVGLLGPNGAGKTTTLRMIGGLIPPTRGAVAIDGQQFTAANAPALRRRIGFLTETPGLWDQLTLEDNLLVYARLF